MNPEDIKRIRAENEKKADKALAERHHKENITQYQQLEDALYHVFTVLIKYMQGATTKTQVVNQIESVATPDVDKVVTAIKEQNKVIEDNRADFTEMKQGLSSLESLLEKLPTEFPEIPEAPSELSIPGLIDAVKDLQKAVESQELTVNAPDVTVQAPSVQVEPTDLKPLQEGLGKLLSATKLNKPKAPEKINLKKLEAAMTKANKFLKELVDKPVGGGGGGGGGSTFQDSTGKLTYPQLEADGSIPVTVKAESSAPYKTMLDDTTTPNVTYVGKAAIGSGLGASVWQIQKIDETSGMIITWGGTGAFDQVWNNRATTVVYA